MLTELLTGLVFSVLVAVMTTTKAQDDASPFQRLIARTRKHATAGKEQKTKTPSSYTGNLEAHIENWEKEQTTLLKVAKHVRNLTRAVFPAKGGGGWDDAKLAEWLATQVGRDAVSMLEDYYRTLWGAMEPLAVAADESTGATRTPEVISAREKLLNELEAAVRSGDNARQKELLAELTVLRVSPEEE